MKRRNHLANLRSTLGAPVLAIMGWLILGILLSPKGIASDLDGIQAPYPDVSAVPARTPQPISGTWESATLADPSATFVFTPTGPGFSSAAITDPLAPLALPYGTQGEFLVPTLLAEPTPQIDPLAPLAPPYAETQLSAYPKLSSEPVIPVTPAGSSLTAIPATTVAPTHSTFALTPARPTSQSVNAIPHSALATTPVLPLDNRPVTPPSLIFQPSLIQEGDEFSARARLQGYYFLSPNVLVGGAVDLTTGNAFSDTQSTGFSVNELYIAASPGGAPNLRFVAGQLDLTSYFDRNSFAKDSLTHFINPVFQTNPALAATAIRSRPAALVSWRAMDAVDVRAAAFSSSGIDNFALDGFAGEVGLNLGNFILRGTYVSATDAGNRDSFPEIFATDRGNGVFGPLPGDREVAYGVNAEWFIPEANLGFFGRYGHQENQTLGLSGETYSGGLNLLDLFMDNDRLGVGYGRGLSNDGLRQAQSRTVPDVFEVFYDFPLASNVRAAVDFQQRNNFSETVLGFRIRADFQLLNQSR